MEIIHVTGKGKKLDALESFHIYKEAKAGNQINDNLTVSRNEIFETIIKQDPYEGYTAPQHRTPKNISVVRSHSPPQEGYATKG